MKKNIFKLIVILIIILIPSKIMAITLKWGPKESIANGANMVSYFTNASKPSEIYYCIDPGTTATTEVVEYTDFKLANDANINSKLLKAYKYILKNSDYADKYKQAALRILYNGLTIDGNQMPESATLGSVIELNDNTATHRYVLHVNSLSKYGVNDIVKAISPTLGIRKYLSGYGVSFLNGYDNKIKDLVIASLKCAAGKLNDATCNDIPNPPSENYKQEPKMEVIKQSSNGVIIKIDASKSTNVKFEDLTGNYTYEGSYLNYESSELKDKQTGPISRTDFYIEFKYNPVSEICNEDTVKLSFTLTYDTVNSDYGVRFYHNEKDTTRQKMVRLVSGEGESDDNVSKEFKPDLNYEEICTEDPCPPYYVNSVCDVKDSGTYIEGINYEKNGNKDKDVKCIINNSDIAKETKYEVNAANGLITNYPSSTKCSNVYCVEDYNYSYPGKVNVVSGVYFKLDFSITANINCFVRVESGGAVNDCDDWSINTDKWFKTSDAGAIEVSYNLPDLSTSGNLEHLTTEKSDVSTSNFTATDEKKYIQKTVTATAKYINGELKFEAQKGNVGTAAAEPSGTYGIPMPSAAVAGTTYKYEINVKNVGMYFNKASLEYGRIDNVVASSSDYNNIKDYACEFSYGECTRSICVKSETVPGKCSICDADKNTGQPAGNCSAEMECEKVIPISDYTGDCEIGDGGDTCPNDTTKTQAMCDAKNYEGKITDVNSQCYKAMCDSGKPVNCTDSKGKTHTQKECDELGLDGKIHETSKECYKTVCGSKSCQEKNSKKIHYQFECDIRRLSGTLDDEGSECYKQLCDCTCPQCTFFSTGATTTITTTENGREFLFRQITTKNINPNDRQLGNNWSGIDANNPHLAIKAQVTRALIDEEYAASTLSIDEIVTREGGGTPEALKTYTEVLKDVADEKATLKVKMTPNMIKDIKSYNNSEKTYVNTTLNCKDYQLETIKTELQCIDNGYTWDETQNACLYKNAFCYSEFFDVYLNEKGYGTEEIKWNNRTTTTTLTLIGTTEDNVKIYSNDYWSIFAYTYLDTDGDGIPNIGPSWQ